MNFYHSLLIYVHMHTHVCVINFRLSHFMNCLDSLHSSQNDNMSGSCIHERVLQKCDIQRGKQDFCTTRDVRNGEG